MEDNKETQREDNEKHSNRFKKGNKIGFASNPQNINKKGNKGSRWNKTLLKDLLTLKLTGKEIDGFKAIMDKFPSVFDGTEEKNMQLFLELKQVSLAFSKNEQVSQKAIDSIKDRIVGKAQQSIKLGEDKENPIRAFNIVPASEYINKKDNE